MGHGVDPQTLTFFSFFFISLVKLGLPHTSAFFMRRVTLRHDASGYDFFFIFDDVLFWMLKNLRAYI